jgi:hypothetical protein
VLVWYRFRVQAAAELRPQMTVAAEQSRLAPAGAPESAARDEDLCVSS